MSAINRATFNNGGITPLGSIDYFIQCNVNLSLINEAIISTYTPGSAPVLFPISVAELTPPIFTIQATGPVYIVPAGFALLIFSTAEKLPTKIFTNPSQFSPVISIDAGTNLTAPLNISAEWIYRFGQFTSNKRICVKSALISISNGDRLDHQSFV